MQPLLTQLLNLDGVAVEDYRDLGEQIVLEVEALHKCGMNQINMGISLYFK
jgi:hypothetical protein